MKSKNNYQTCSKLFITKTKYKPKNTEKEHLCKVNPCVVGHCLDTTHKDFKAGKLKMKEDERKELEKRIFDDKICICPEKHSGEMCEKR